MRIGPGVIASGRSVPSLVESLPSVTWPADSLKTENWAISLIDSLDAWLYLHRKIGTWESIDDLGAMGKNKTAPYSVAEQRQSLWVMRHGFSESFDGHTQEDYILRATSALAYAFDFQNDGGWFDNGLHVEPITAIEADSFFINSFVWSHRLIAGEPSLSSLLTSYVAYNTALNANLAWQYDNVAQIIDDGEDTPNRLLFSAVAFNIGGRILSNTDYRNQGIALATLATELLHDDGYFLEKGGWDSSYQGVSMMNLCALFFHTADSSFKASVKAVLAAAAVWMDSRVSTAGSNAGYISTDGNTRTGPDGEIGPSGKVKEVNYPEVALAMFYTGCILEELDYIITAMRIVNYAGHNG